MPLPILTRPIARSEFVRCSVTFMTRAETRSTLWIALLNCHIRVAVPHQLYLLVTLGEYGKLLVFSRRALRLVVTTEPLTSISNCH